MTPYRDFYRQPGQQCKRRVNSILDRYRPVRPEATAMRCVPPPPLPSPLIRYNEAGTRVKGGGGGACYTNHTRLLTQSCTCIRYAFYSTALPPTARTTSPMIDRAMIRTRSYSAVCLRSVTRARREAVCIRGLAGRCPC